MKMWSGRFEQDIDKQADEFNSSLSFDCRLYKFDILGSIAHCTMLGECGIIEKADADIIVKTLKEILADIENGKIEFKNAEDIHMFVEEELTRRIGTVGKRLHTSRSRNDQVALDLRMYLRESVDKTVAKLKTLIETLINIAKNNFDTIIPAYTHMQKAQPTTLAHHYMAYAEMFLRDAQRFSDCRKRINVMPLGACALCGTTYPINRERVAELLGFDSITANSIDSVSDRDFALEYLSACCVFMMHMSRFNEEIIYWATDEFGYIKLDDRYSTGSSIMPQKKNPDMCELIRGKTGRCYGHLMSLLTVMKGLPLAYNKDMQEDKEAVFDAEDTIFSVLNLFTAMLPTFTFDKQRLYKGAGGGYTAATDCADYLVKKGMPFRQAHEVIGRLVIYASNARKPLNKLTVQEYKALSPMFEEDILKAVKLENVISNRKVPGAPSKDSVKKEIAALQKQLKKL